MRDEDQCISRLLESVRINIQRFELRTECISLRLDLLQGDQFGILLLPGANTFLVEFFRCIQVIPGRFDLLGECDILRCHFGKFHRLDQCHFVTLFDFGSGLNEVVFNMPSQYGDDLLFLIGKLSNFGISRDNFPQWFELSFFQFDHIGDSKERA